MIMRLGQYANVIFRDYPQPNVIFSYTGNVLMDNELSILKEKARITNATIAEESGVPESTVTRIINGRTASPSADVYAAIKNAITAHIDEPLSQVEPSNCNNEECHCQVAKMFERVLTEKEKFIARLERRVDYQKWWIMALATALFFILGWEYLR